MKKTYNGRQPQNMKSGILEQPMIGSHSNVKLKLSWPNQNWFFFLNEDDIIKLSR